MLLWISCIESVLLKLPVLVGLIAKAAIRSKLWCVVTLPVATSLLTVLVVRLTLGLKWQGSLHLVRTVRTLALPPFVTLSCLISLFMGSPSFLV